MENLKLCDTIGYYRKRQGLTQEELAKKLGVTNQSVSKWESAQCCPDIGLLPKLAAIFGISIDELFGNTTGKEIHYDLCTEFPWKDDNTIRIIQTRGRKILKSQEADTAIEVVFPPNCNENTKQYFQVEVFGNISCDRSINGDVICHGTIECNQINGDIKDTDNVSCNGDINGSVNTDNNLSCGGSIGGGVNCGNNLSCGGSISGGVNCENNLSCGGNINGAVCCDNSVACGGYILGDVDCGGDVECYKIEGNVECQGNIIYK